MSEELQAVIETPASETSTTAVPGTEVIETPVETPAPAPKTFTQEELDAAIGKRLAREQRKWEREHRTVAAPPTPVDLPPAEQFESVEAYAEALAQKKRIVFPGCRLWHKPRKSGRSRPSWHLIPR